MYSTIGHYFQLHAIITEDSPINVRIFQKREDAAKWLGVPIEAAGAEIRCWLKMSAEHNQLERSRVNGENCSLAVLLCVTIRATDETAARR